MTYDDIIKRLENINYSKVSLRKELIKKLIADLKIFKRSVNEENVKWNEDDMLKNPWYMLKQTITPEMEAKLIERFPSYRKFIEGKK